MTGKNDNDDSQKPILLIKSIVLPNSEMPQMYALNTE